MSLTLGSLFSGYGGLDLGISSVLDTETRWVADNDRGPRAILAHHWPDVPNLGDITTIDWARVEPVDVICGGSPCQDPGVGGARAGRAPGTRCGLWEPMIHAIAAIRPRLVVWENVRGSLSAPASSAADEENAHDYRPCVYSRADEAHSDMVDDEGRLGDQSTGPVLRALGRVLGDLAGIGYDAQWCGVRAADIGAPHNRLRIFVAAYPVGLGCAWAGKARNRKPRPPDSGGIPVALLPTTRAYDFAATPGAPAANRHCEQGRGSLGGVIGFEHITNQDWGKYAPAIRRWESVMGRPAPAPTVLTEGGKPKLSPQVAEWHMGLPAGWVTDVPGLSILAQIKALGNGVVPQQAAYALDLMAEREMEMSTA